MMNFDFVLTPAYCLFNGVAVLKEEGSSITFILENEENQELKWSLEKAFESHLEFIKRNKNCPEKYKGVPEICFKGGSRNDVKKCISGLFSRDAEIGADGRGLELKDGKNSGCDGEHGELESAAAVILLDSLILEAVKKHTTDIHIENNWVRFRINGRLEKELSLNSERAYELVQRIKLLSGMDVIESRHCQDGHFVFSKSIDHRVYIRVSSIPVIKKSSANVFENCESLVLRILDEKRIPLRLEKLGFNERQLQTINSLIELQQGLVLVCGPTGSGKSTTIGSMLQIINEGNKQERKIVSIEDPPEYVLEGVSQVEVSKNTGNDFETILNHIFRQDPDVIMIGEIRDEKSAAAAIRASLTGHLVFATLHTGSAGMSILRLENLGVNRNLLASVLKGVIIQNLGYLGDVPNLVADVCMPVEKFDCKVFGKNESQLEELFEHQINSVEAIKRTLEILKSNKRLDSDVYEMEIKKEFIDVIESNIKSGKEIGQVKVENNMSAQNLKNEEGVAEKYELNSQWHSNNHKKNKSKNGTLFIRRKKTMKKSRKNEETA